MSPGWSRCWKSYFCPSLFCTTLDTRVRSRGWNLAGRDSKSPSNLLNSCYVLGCPWEGGWVLLVREIWVSLNSLYQLFKKREKKRKKNDTIWTFGVRPRTTFAFPKMPQDRISLCRCALGTNVGRHFVTDCLFFFFGKSTTTITILNISNLRSYSACSNKYDRLTLVHIFNPFGMIIWPLSACLMRPSFWSYEVLDPCYSNVYSINF